MKSNIWLFVDGGAHLRIKGDYNSGYNGSYAGIATIEQNGKLVEFAKYGGYKENTTTPRMEFTAISESLISLGKLLYDTEFWDNYGITEEGGNLYIVCDALNSVKTLTDWVHNWIALTMSKFGDIFKTDENGKKTPNLFRKEKGKLVPVNNQDLIASILRLLDIYVNGKFNIKFIHINSHITQKGFMEAYIKFQDFNNMILSKEDFTELVNYNEKVDSLVNEYYTKGEMTK